MAPSGSLATTEHLEGGELVNVAGESHYQPALRELAPWDGREDLRYETVAELVPEPENPHDGDAVRVEIGGHLVGYLPRRAARAYRSLIAVYVRKGRRMTCDAMIAGRAVDGDTMRGVFLKLPPPLQEFPGGEARGAR
jgi:hypothetical protein